MSLSFSEAIKNDLNRLVFINKQREKAPRRKPKRVGKTPARGTLYALRNTRLAIREGALRRVQIVISYRKETTGELKSYVVNPYSYRMRRLKTGIRKMLYAWDVDDHRIKSFVLGNIRNVAISDRKFVPMWKVEF